MSAEMKKIVLILKAIERANLCTIARLAHRDDEFSEIKTQELLDKMTQEGLLRFVEGEYELTHQVTETVG